MSPVKTRRISSGGKQVTQIPSTSSTDLADPCYFCTTVVDKNDNDYGKASTLKLDKRVRNCAETLNDQSLTASGDMGATDACYDCNCLTSLYNKASHNTGSSASEYNTIQIAKAQVLNKLIDFIEEKRGTGKSLTMSDIT